MTITAEQLARLRQAAERVCGRRGGENMMSVLASDVLALLDKLAAVTAERDAAVEMANQHIESSNRLGHELAQMTAARDEACATGRELVGIALDLVNGRAPSISTSEMVRSRADHLASLRQVGTPTERGGGREGGNG